MYVFGLFSDFYGKFRIIKYMTLINTQYCVLY